jgi:hypothetical protein
VLIKAFHDRDGARGLVGTASAVWSSSPSEAESTSHGQEGVERSRALAR